MFRSFSRVVTGNILLFVCQVDTFERQARDGVLRKIKLRLDSVGHLRVRMRETFECQ